MAFSLRYNCAINYQAFFLCSHSCSIYALSTQVVLFVFFCTQGRWIIFPRNKSASSHTTSCLICGVLGSCAMSYSRGSRRSRAKGGPPRRAISSAWITDSLQPSLPWREISSKGCATCALWQCIDRGRAFFVMESACGLRKGINDHFLSNVFLKTFKRNSKHPFCALFFSDSYCWAIT